MLVVWESGSCATRGRMGACAGTQGKWGRIAPLGESLWLNHVIQFSNHKVRLQLLQLLFLNRRYVLLKHPLKLIMYFLFFPSPQCVLAPVCLNILLHLPHSPLHCKKSKWWQWCSQQCLQGIGIFLHNWNCCFCFWISYNPCTGWSGKFCFLIFIVRHQLLSIVFKCTVAVCKSCL